MQVYFGYFEAEENPGVFIPLITVHDGELKAHLSAEDLAFLTEESAKAFMNLLAEAIQKGTPTGPVLPPEFQQ